MKITLEIYKKGTKFEIPDECNLIPVFFRHDEKVELWDVEKDSTVLVLVVSRLLREGKKTDYMETYYDDKNTLKVIKKY